MIELFKDYEKECLKLITSANKKVALLSQSSSSSSLLSELSRDISQAEDFLKKMENQLLSLPPSESSHYRNRLSRHAESLRKLKNSRKSTEDRSNKVALIGTDPRSGIVNNTMVLEESGQSINRSLQIGSESETIATDTLSNLKTQKNTLLRINDKLGDVTSNIGDANRVLTKMDRRRIFTKLILICMIFLLILCNSLLLYFRFFS